jgi:mannose-1-phosphate guanylyltransferase
MILAAGLGTRLRPLSEQIPKCMIKFGGKPLLQYTIEWLRGYGITDVVINLHHLPDAVVAHFRDGAAWEMRLTYIVEPVLLGTAGAVKNAAPFFGESPFLVWYGDNLSTCRLDRLWAFHRANGGTATMALHRRDDVTQSGIVALDHTCRVTRFLEKPSAAQVFSRWVNAGILILEPRAVDAVAAGQTADFGRDVFPDLLARDEPIYGYRMQADEGLWWIDRPEDLQRLEVLWPSLPFSCIHRARTE